MKPGDVVSESYHDNEIRKREARIAELEAAMREITRQVKISDDPEHLTLSLVGRIAEDTLKP